MMNEQEDMYLSSCSFNLYTSVPIIIHRNKFPILRGTLRFSIIKSPALSNLILAASFETMFQELHLHLFDYRADGLNIVYLE